MIIDYILDRKDDEKLLNEGYTHRQTPDGKLQAIAYNPHDFYMNIMGYVGGCGSKWAERITRAMDSGTESDVRKELCRYIDEGEYNPDIKDYINSRKWLS